MEKERISAEELLQKIKYEESVFILDVRDEDKYRTGSIEVKGKQVENIPYVAIREEAQNVHEQVASLPKGTQIVTVCTTGNKAQKAASLLRAQGYSVVSLEGGLTAWQEKAKGTSPKGLSDSVNK